MLNSRSPTEIDKHIGQRLKELRRMRGLSQKDLGDTVSLSLKQIRKYEHGENRISASKLYDFSVILSVQAEYFYEGLGDGTQDQQNAERSDNKQYDEIQSVLKVLILWKTLIKKKRLPNFFRPLSSNKYAIFSFCNAPNNGGFFLRKPAQAHTKIRHKLILRLILQLILH